MVCYVIFGGVARQTSVNFVGSLGSQNTWKVFRDIELFNLAMLARQSWHMLKEPAKCEGAEGLYIFLMENF